MAVELTCR